MEMLNEEERILVERARQRFHEIIPCSHKSWKECFTEVEDSLLFWFNDVTGNTHMEILEGVR